MKYKKIILFFCIALPVSILMRMLQLLYTVDTETGFFLPEYKTAGYNIIVVIVAFCAVTAVLCFTAHRNPEHPPKPTPLLSAASVLLAAAIAYELMHEASAANVKQWQSAALMLTGIAAIIYLTAFALKLFVKFKLPDFCALIPAVYYILRIICSFTAISSLALISDNILIMAAYCLCLVFMLCFAKLYNGIDTEYNFRKMLSSGLAASIVCFTQSVPHIIINLLNHNSYLHTSNAANLAVLAAGVFVTVFIFTHFALKNTAVEHRRSYESENQKFYM